jgi:lipoprotein-anchoring transpeptidase ErfK/SrfK
VRRSLGWVALGVATVLGLAGCQGGGTTSSATSSGASQQAQAEPSVSATPEPTVTFSPAAGATDVRMDQQVSVSADQGALTSVQVKTTAGKVLDGELAAGGSTWHSTGTLLANTSYSVTAMSASADGRSKTDTSTFTTLKPTSTSSVVLIPGDDWKVGVGMPVVVQFGRDVKNKDAAVKALTVTTTPKVEGAWHWMSDQAVWWRPKDYWPSGTKVSVRAAIDSAELSPGVWGRRTYTSTFSIGDRVISTVDMKRHTMTVRKNDALVKVVPVTTGKPGFMTREGIKVIMDKQESVRMDATTTGTDPKDPEFYNEIEHWAMRLTWSGEYLHARPGSEGAFGRSNVSHGCTGMSNENAKWMFDFSRIGDVVIYTGSTRQLEWGNGYTAWQMNWNKWSGAGKAA